MPRFNTIRKQDEIISYNPPIDTPRPPNAPDNQNITPINVSYLPNIRIPTPRALRREEKEEQRKQRRKEKEQIKILRIESRLANRKLPDTASPRADDKSKGNVDTIKSTAIGTKIPEGSTSGTVMDGIGDLFTTSNLLIAGAFLVVLLLFKRK